jgi:hypothetical protein
VLVCRKAQIAGSLFIYVENMHINADERVAQLQIQQPMEVFSLIFRKTSDLHLSVACGWKMEIKSSSAFYNSTLNANGTNRSHKSNYHLARVLNALGCCCWLHQFTQLFFFNFFPIYKQPKEIS